MNVTREHVIADQRVTNFGTLVGTHSSRVDPVVFNRYRLRSSQEDI